MNFLITGATGYIGVQLTKKLVGEGHTVHALFRSESKTADLRHDQIKLFKGDILDPASLEKAAKKCDGIFHVAAFAKPWDKDPQPLFKYKV